jgi:hypothetical protein
VRRQVKKDPGFDELMIVNPQRAGARGDTIRPGDLMLGDDGTIYRLSGGSPVDQGTSSGQFFLGDDGALYRLVRAPNRRKRSR